MQKCKSYLSLLLCIVMCFASFSTVFAEDITLYSNGNPIEDNTYSSGILTAKSTGDGLFAIARYKNNELIALSLAEDYNNVGMTVDDEDGVSTKIFRFLDDGTPLCVNKELAYAEKSEKRIYANEKFNGSTRLNINGTTVKLEADRLTVTGNNTRLPTIAVLEADRYVIAEAKFALPDTTTVNVDLISLYTDMPKPLVSMTSSNTITTQNKKQVVKFGNGWVGTVNKSELTSGFAVAVVIDTQNKTYDTYFNGEKKTSGSSITDAISGAELGSNFSFMYARPNVDATLYVDDIEIYSTNDGSLLDLGNEIPNVHRADFPGSRLSNATYDRPDYKTIASLTSAKSHPRIMINDAKIAEIKNSKDANMVSWRNAILADADSLINTGTYNYVAQDVTSIGGVDIGLDRVMTLAMAYNLTGQNKYVTRAYNEVAALNNKFPLWGNRKALSVGEASVMHAVCYDWMYDALTTEQKNYLKTTVMTQALIPAYKTYHKQYISDITVDTNNWWDVTNNWNAVCNGGFLTASLAFMESDMFTCATLAEACLRGLEHMMAVYAPGGAWSEGAMYWGYATKYVTIAAASLETSCGSLYGIDNADGFSETSLYGLALEGKTAVMNFGDASSDHVKAPFMFYWSRIYNKPEYTSAALYSMDRFGFKPNTFDLIYYDADMNNGSFAAPESYYFEGTEVVSFTSGPDSNDTMIAMSGGPGHATSHDHLDSGAVILEKNGERLFRDIGAEHYDADGYFTEKRHKLFRARPEAHNIFVINPENITDTDNTTEYFGQYLDAVSAVTSYSADAKTATMDLTEAYARDASKASRTIALDGDDVVITDTISLNKTSNVYWNWYIMVPKGNIVISSDGKSATVTLNGKKFNISFETSANYTLEVQEAEQYVDTDPNGNNKRHPNTDYRRLVVNFNQVSGNISLKTTVK